MSPAVLPPITQTAGDFLLFDFYFRAVRQPVAKSVMLPVFFAHARNTRMTKNINVLILFIVPPLFTEPTPAVAYIPAVHPVPSCCHTMFSLLSSHFPLQREHAVRVFLAILFADDEAVELVLHCIEAAVHWIIPRAAADRKDFAAAAVYMFVRLIKDSNSDNAGLELTETIINNPPQNTITTWTLCSSQCYRQEHKVPHFL